MTAFEVGVRTFLLTCCLLLQAFPLFAQGARLWVLRAGGEMAEFDPGTFAAKGSVKIPAEAVQSPQFLSVNRLGQMLYAPLVPLPVAEDEGKRPHKFWFWNGHEASSMDQGLTRESGTQGSNRVITESVPAPALSADGTHLLWFANQERRLQREDVELSTVTTWQAWQTDLAGANREEIASRKFPDCRCTTGTCSETCPSGEVWYPAQGVGSFFLMSEYVAGQTEIT